MKYIILLLSLIFATSAWSFSKEAALQISKNRILALKDHYASLAYTCFMFEADCQIESREQEAVIKWLSDEFHNNNTDVRFASGADNFMIDGAIRVAKTGNHWGAPVYFNEDLLVVQKSPAEYQPLGFLEILGIFIHEFGHHQDMMLAQMGLSSLRHEELDEIAAKVMTYLQDRTRKTVFTSREVPGLRPDSTVEVLQMDVESFNGIRNIWSKVFLDSPELTMEISSTLVRALQCPREYNNGHLTFVGKPYYASFQKVRAPAIAVKDRHVVLKQEIGAASVLCVDEKMGRYNVYGGYTDGQLKLDFTLNADGTLTWNAGLSSFMATMPKKYQ